MLNSVVGLGQTYYVHVSQTGYGAYVRLSDYFPARVIAG
jgi:hypothetical protein